MYRGINLNKTRKVTYEGDSDPKSVFEITESLPVEVVAMLNDKFTDSQGKQQFFTRNIEVVKYGLKGVEHFQDSEGNDFKLEFVDGGKYKVLSDNSIQALGINLGSGFLLLDWIATKILEVNTVSGEEAKN